MPVIARISKVKLKTAKSLWHTHIVSTQSGDRTISRVDMRDYGLHLLVCEIFNYIEMY